MSIVIAKRKPNGNFLIGSDSQITTMGQRKEIDPGCKLFNPDGNRDILVGIVGSLRDANIIHSMEELLDYSDIRRESLTVKSLVDHTVKKIQDKLKEQGRLVVDQGQWLWDSSIVIAHKDKCFIINSDFCVQEVKDFIAIGAPSEYAYGAKKALDSYISGRKLKPMIPLELVTNLIDMTIQLTNTVDYPICIGETDKDTIEIIEKD